MHAFEGHIACSAATRSEIVIPILDAQGRVFAVLDVDSNYTAAFGEVDERGLERLCEWLGERYGSASR